MMKTALIFPGYKSQHVGMAKDIYDESRIVQEYFEEASNCLSINFVRLCFASSDNELNRLDNALLSIFVVSTALAALLKEKGIVPDLVAGFDTGEYAALHTCQGLSLPDGLYFLNKYASFYADFVSSNEYETLLVEGLSAPKLKKFLEEAVSSDAQSLSLAVTYDDKKHLISGFKADLMILKKLLPEDGVVITHEGWELGLHSSAMEPVARAMKDYLEKVDVKDLSIPLVGGSDGKVVTDGQRLKERLVHNMVTPIAWSKVLKRLEDMDRIICVGPGTALVKAIAQAYPDKNVISFATLQDIDLIIHRSEDEQL